MKVYSGQTLTNAFATYKIDGVNAIWNGSSWLSRNSKPLYNLPDPVDNMTVVEVYTGTFKSTITAVRTQSGMNTVQQSHMYQLKPYVDARLVVHPNKLRTITQASVTVLMDQAVELGYEGLVLYSDQGVFKVKQIVTYESTIREVVAGKGKFTSMMGALVTDVCKVGTGFTNEERQYFWDNRVSLIGTVIEISAMEVTESGSLRMPRYFRERFDKSS